jgi:hypothetical protein
MIACAVIFSNFAIFVTLGAKYANTDELDREELHLWIALDLILYVTFLGYMPSTWDDRAWTLDSIIGVMPLWAIYTFFSSFAQVGFKWDLSYLIVKWLSKR